MSDKYKPPVVKESGAKGDSGVAELTWGDKRVAIAFEDGETYKVPIEELPEYCQGWRSVESAFVTMKGDNEEVLGMRPINGVYTVHFNQFAVRNEDDPPAPTTYKGKFGPYEAFTALLEIVKGKFKGAVLPTFFIYKFADADDVLAIQGEGNAAQKLADFLDYAGAWEQGEMAYSDNVLPALQKRLKRAAKTFQVVVKKGFVESITASDFEEDEEEAPKKKVVEEDDDESAPKSKKQPVNEDDEEETPRKKSKSVDDEDEDDQPKKKAKKVVEGDDDDI